MDAFLLIPLQTKFGSILVYIGINLSIRLSVCLKKKFKINVCSIYFNEKHWNSLLQIDRFWPERVSWTWPRVICASSRLLFKNAQFSSRPYLVMKNEKPKFDAKIAWYDVTCKCLDLDLWSIIQSQCQNGAFITSKYNVMAYK